MKKRIFNSKWIRHVNLQAAEAFRLWFGINLTKQDINEAKGYVRQPISVAITEKIGTGKTTVCSLLRKEGFRFLSLTRK